MDGWMDEPLSKRRRRVLKSEGKIEESITISPDLPDHSVTPWTTAQGNQRSIKPFSENSSISNSLKDMSNESPAAFYELMVTDEIFQEIADCTNIFAEKKVTKYNESHPAILDQWIPTNHTEIKKFFGLIMFMGIVKLPKLTDYWSKDTILSHPFPETIMSRLRFKMILHALHLSIDDETNKMDPLHITCKLLNALNSNFANHFSPSEDLFIEKGTLRKNGPKDKQTKRQDEMRFVKLCSAPGYVYKVGVFFCKNIEDIKVRLLDTIMTLCNDCLNKGHTLYTDDCYTNLDLARKLLENETHLVGFVKKHRMQLPKEVIGAKLEAGDFIARESHDGITVMKLKEKEVTLLLSTKHSTQFGSTCTTRGKTIFKPQIIIDYEKTKEAVKLCNKIAETSSTCTLESLIWYKKFAIDLLLNVAVVNAFTLYKSVTDKNIEIVDFRKQLVEYLCQKEETTVEEPSQEAVEHKLLKKEGPVRLNRRTCHQCYKDKTQMMGRMLAKNRSPKVATYCENCPNKPFLCLSCFNKTHNN